MTATDTVRARTVLVAPTVAEGKRLLAEVPEFVGATVVSPLTQYGFTPVARVWVCIDSHPWPDDMPGMSPPHRKLIFLSFALRKTPGAEPHMRLVRSLSPLEWEPYLPPRSPERQPEP